MMKKPRAIIFDWGGTLVSVTREPDTFAPAAASAIAALRASGCAVSDASADNFSRHFAESITSNAALDNLSEFDSLAVLRSWSANENVALPADISPIVDALWAPWVGCLDPFDNVLEPLRKLRAAGFTLGLLSNCPAIPPACRAEVARQGIGALLDFTLFSSELGVRKPDQRIYDEALSRARAACNGSAGNLRAEDILFVGDTPIADITGPARCGMRTTLVRTGHWNGDESNLNCKPDAIVHSVHDLPTMLATV